MNNGQEQMRKDDVEEKHLIFYVIGNSLEFPITQKGTFFIWIIRFGCQKVCI